MARTPAPLPISGFASIMAANRMELTMEDPWGRAVFTPSANYRDPAAALDWLQRVFGFERVMVLTDDAGRVAHAEMSFQGRGQVMIGGDDWLHPSG